MTAHAPDFHWPGRARLAMSFVINVEEGSEMSVARGDKGPEPVDELGVSLKIRCATMPTNPTMTTACAPGQGGSLAPLPRRGSSPPVTAAAQSLEVAPHVADLIVKGGHETCSTGWRWVHQFSYDEPRETEIHRPRGRLDPCHDRRTALWLALALSPHRPGAASWPRPGSSITWMTSPTTCPAGTSSETTQGRRPIVIVPYALDTNDMKFWSPPVTPPPNGWIMRWTPSTDSTTKGPTGR